MGLKVSDYSGGGKYEFAEHTGGKYEIREEFVDKNEFKKLQEHCNDLETIIKQSQGKIKNLQKEKKTLQEEKRNLEDEINTISGTRRNHPLPIVLCILFGLIAAIMSMLYFANLTGVSTSGNYHSIANENAELKGKVSSLANQLESSLKRIHDLETQIANQNRDMKKSGNAPSEKVKELEDQLKKSKADNENLRKENQRLQNGLDAALNELRK